MIKPLLTGLALMLTSGLFAQKTVLHAGKLLDVKNGKILTEQTIVVEDDKIISVNQVNWPILLLWRVIRNKISK